MVTRAKKTGSVMALVLFAIILLFLSGIGVLSLGQNTRIFSIRTAAEIVARSAADDGITKALWQLNWNLEDGWAKYPLPYENLTELPNCNGATYSYVVVKAKVPSADAGLIDFVGRAYPTAPKDGDYVVRSIGRYNGAEKVIYATLRLRGAGDECVIVRDTLTLKADTIVAGSDSRNGPQEDPSVLVEIGTTSIGDQDVILNNGVIVKGNVLVGVDGVVDTVITDHTTNGVEGLMYPMIEEVEFPYIYPPALPNMGEIDFKAKTVMITGSGRYSSIRLKNGVSPTILQIGGGDVVLYVTGDIIMGEGCEITILKGSTLNLYVDGDIKAGNSEGFNNEGVPPDFKLWGNWREGPEVPQDWELKAKSEFFGQVYAPSADLIVKAKGDLYGAFTANSFNMMNGGNLYYDGALREVDPYQDPAVRFVLKRWYEQ